MHDDHIFPFLWMRGESEEVMRREMQAIYDCGIRAVCVEARPHKDFCGPGWWHDMDIILDEAEKRGMRVWILDDKHFPTGYANGLIEEKYPERKKQYLNFTSADVFGASRPIELHIQKMLRPIVKFWEMGRPANEEERAKNTLYSVTALRFADGNLFTEERVDLTGQVQDGWLRCQLPEGQWKIVVVYRTRTDGGDEAYINLIDRVSAHTQIEGVYEAHYQRYGDKFGGVIAGFFSDEPQFGNYPGFEGEAIVGKKQMPMPWSDELEAMLLERYPEGIGALVPYLWHSTESMERCPRFRYDYMDCVSLLYERNFSCAIGTWCREHGVEYIGHVVEDNSSHSRLGMGAAHYFRAMSGQDMAGIDCIGGQVIYGAPTQLRTDMVSIDGEFCHYTLGRLGASSAHLDPMKKGRLMCELFGAYGWGFGVRDQKYVLDHLLSRGVNYLVPHAFSMAEYPDPDCPPHYYARGNNPEYPWFQELMRYADRMCRALSGGKHVADVAVLYDAEAEWAGERMPMQQVARVLQTNQIEFDFVSLDMLTRQAERYRTQVLGKTLCINGQSFGALIVPYMQRIPRAFCSWLTEHPDFPVIFVDALPESVVDPSGADTDLPACVSACEVTKLDGLAARLEDLGLRAVRVAPAFASLSVYRYEKDGKRLFFLLNESADQVFDGEIALHAQGALAIHRSWPEAVESLAAEKRDQRMHFTLRLQPAESCLIVEGEQDAPLYQPLPARMEDAALAQELNGPWAVSSVKAINYPRYSPEHAVQELKPFSDTERSFSGVIRYRTEFTTDAVHGDELLWCGQVFEVMRVRLNGVLVGTAIQPPYRLPVGAALKEGVNTLEIEVATTPERDQLNYPASPFVMKHSPMEPTGLFGRICIVRP